MVVFKIILSFLPIAFVITLFGGACSFGPQTASKDTIPSANKDLALTGEPAIITDPSPDISPEFPDLQAELTDHRFRTSVSPLIKFDFLNHTYPLPRGWQNPDGSDVTLQNGKVEPVAEGITEDLSDEEKARIKQERRIGLTHVVTKYFDATGDGLDEAIVILKIETTGNAIPQIVYIFELKDDKPELIWYFRTGDRSDGGLKDIRPEKGSVVVELFGQDRFLLGEIETGKIYGDEEQLCCPTHFTRTSYKWNGKHFIRQGKRETYLVADPQAPPAEDINEALNSSASRRR